jgi:chemotaxis protein methyltransferase CheR
VPLLFDRGPRLREEEFRLLRDLVNDFCGIDFADETMFVVERRLRERVMALGLQDFEQYYQYLRYHPDAATEIERAVDELTTNETYFFREEYQLRAFAKEVLPELRQRLVAQGAKRLALWSAGCSTGEEAYTLAMLVHDSGLFSGWDVRIFGNDISRRVLQTARRAVYGPSSFRAMPPEYARYFVEGPEGRQVHPSIRSMCHFGHLNLLDARRVAIVGRVDAIFCRNVLIYFDTDSRRKVIDNFYERLAPGGYLMLGHSESLLHVTTAFELAHLSSDLVYRKPLRQDGVSWRNR